MIYIQRKDAHNLETVDQFKTRKEALKMLLEYTISDPYGEYYLSSRACKEWHEIDDVYEPWQDTYEIRDNMS